MCRKDNARESRSVSARDSRDECAPIRHQERAGVKDGVRKSNARRKPINVFDVRAIRNAQDSKQRDP